MQSNVINTALAGEYCQNNNSNAQIVENIYICIYDLLELQIKIKINDPRSFKRYFNSSKYGQKNSGPHNDKLPVGLIAQLVEPAP